MNNDPVAWMGKDYDGLKTNLYFDVEKNKLPYRLYESAIPLYTQDQLEEARKLGMKQERALWNLSASTQEIMDTHPVKELTDAITLLEKYADKLEDERPNKGLSDVVLECVEILRKASEK